MNILNIQAHCILHAYTVLQKSWHGIPVILLSDQNWWFEDDDKLILRPPAPPSEANQVKFQQLTQPYFMGVQPSGLPGSLWVKNNCLGLHAYKLLQK